MLWRPSVWAHNTLSYAANIMSEKNQNHAFNCKNATGQRKKKITFSLLIGIFD